MFLGAKGNAQLHIHHIEDALASFERASEILGSLRGSPEYDIRLEIGTVNNIGNVYFAQENFGQAEKRYQKALDLARRAEQITPGANLGELADTLINHANTLNRMLRTDEATPEYNEAIAIYRSLARKHSETYSGRLAIALSNFAAMLSREGQLARAEVLSEEALEIQNRLVQAAPAPNASAQGFGSSGLSKESNEAVQATILSNKAVDHYRKREYKEASELLARAADLFTSLARSYPEVYLPQLAMTLGNQASALAALDDHEAAEKIEDKTLDVYRQLTRARPGQFESGLASALTNIGSSRLEMGKPKQAIVALEEAVAIRRSLLGVQSTSLNPLLAFSLSILGNAYLSDGQFNGAEKAYNEAVELDPNDLEDGGWRALVGLSRLARARGNTRHAWDLLRKALLKTEDMRIRTPCP